jgi:hypothetical protein
VECDVTSSDWRLTGFAARLKAIKTGRHAAESNDSDTTAVGFGAYRVRSKKNISLA